MAPENGAGCRGTNPVIRGWELSAPPLISGEEKSLEVALTITGQ